MTAKPALLAPLLLVALAAGLRAADSEGLEITRFLPKFKTRRTVDRLESGLAPAKKLDSALRKSTERIWSLIEEYRKEPAPELEDQIYNAVAESGGVIVEHITQIEGQRDRMRDELRELNVNVAAVLRNIGQYTTALKGRQGDVVEEARALKEQLTTLAQHLVDNPEDKERRNEFRRRVMELKRFRYKLRLYARNQQLYTKLAEQIAKVSHFFTLFEERLDGVLESLALQKRFIAMNLTALRDKAKVVAWLRGEAGGAGGVAAMMKQLADLAGSLQSFEKVIDVMMHLGGDFDNFAEMCPALDDPVFKDSIVGDDDLDELIQKFAAE